MNTVITCSLLFQDLHRTGCSGFSGQDNEEERALLKRVLLAYARWNKNVGYCQGFNVLAALILQVVQRKEDDALKVRERERKEDDALKVRERERKTMR